MKTTGMQWMSSGPARGLMQNPAMLLLITGTCIGINFPLGKIASAAGVSPMIWASLISMGAVLMLLPVLLVQRRLSLPRGRSLRYVMVSALLSFIGPNLLLFSVIPHAGAGYTGMMFALSPVFTLTLASLFRLNPPNRLGLIGIAVGLTGAVIVSIGRSAGAEAPPLLWIGAALSIPMLLAFGNVYRTLDWPDQASPDVLAFWSHCFAGLIFSLLLWLNPATLTVDEVSRVPLVALMQLTLAGLTYPFFFRLQLQGGPVVLSQIGYVAAAVGLIAATLLLGERYTPVTWFGAMVIVLGIGFTVAASRTSQHPRNR